MPQWAAQSFASLRTAPYRLYWSGLLFGFSALWVGFVVRGFLAFDLTGSNAALGGLFIAFGVPQLILTPAGGLVADRVARTTIIVTSLALFAVEYLLLAVLVLAGVIEYWMLLVGSVFEGALVAFFMPARTALVGDLVEEDAVGNGVALLQVSFTATRVVGPAIAGALIAVQTIGSGGTYLIACLLFALSAAVLAPLPRITPARVSGASPFADIANGVSYVLERPALLVLVLIGYAVSMTAFPYIVFVPSVVDEVFEGGSVALGLMTSGIAIGALAASLGSAAIADGPHAWRAHWLLTVFFCIALMVYAIAPSFAVAMMVGVAVGAGETGFFTLNQALSMRYTEPEYFGRVQAVLLLSFGLFGIVALPIGVLADSIGIRQTLFAEGLVGLLLVMGILSYAARIGAAADASRYVSSFVPIEESAT